MYLRIRKLSLTILVLFSALSAVASAVDTTVTLTADDTLPGGPSTTELVTFGLPLAQGDVDLVSEIRVRIGGVEQLASIEPGLTWHWADGSLRSVTIQLHDLNMTGGDVVVTIDDSGNAGTQAFVNPSIGNGWIAGPANKAGMPFPRIFAVHDLDYLASTGIIPPYAPGSPNAGVGKLQSDQFDNGFGELDFTLNGDSSQSSYLFDRATAMMKAYMITGETKFLKEGFMTKQLYFNHIRDDGAPPSTDFATGGDGCFTFGNVGCSDGKYIYTQPAKLAWALFGDNSQWDTDLINNMALQADLGSWQPGTRDAYDSEAEAFTERAAGIVGLAEIGAYEITGDLTILSHLTERIDVLKAMQQTTFAWETANSWAKSGGFTHSWENHEGGTYPGDGTADDRRFSPWMSENIVDFLWQTYTVTARADIPEMLRQVGNAIDEYGFTSEYQSGLGLSASYATKAGLSTIAMSCNAPDTAPVSILYSASNVASAAALAATAASEGGGADQHNVETVLALSLAFYFETDTAARNRLFSRIQHIERQWLHNNTAAGDTQDCSTIFNSGVYRLFNWQHRSNSVGTWGWAANEIAGIYDVTPNAFTFSNQSSLEPSTATTSNAFSVSGLGVGASVAVSTDAGTLVINGGECASGCSVSNDDTVAVRVTSAGTSLGSVSATVTMGSQSDTFTATTKALALSYTGYVLVSALGGSDSCADGSVWHYQCGDVDQWVPAADYASHPLVATCGVPDGTNCLNEGTSRRWTEVAGLTEDTFLLNCATLPPVLTSRTSCPVSLLIKNGGVLAVDDYPSAVTLTALTEQGLSNPVTSNTVTIAGLGSGIFAPVTTTNGTLIINGGDCPSSCSVDNGDTVAVRVTTSGTYSTPVTATVSIGIFQTIFTATTSAAPGTTPDAFAFTTVFDQATGSLVTSNAITVAGLGVSTSVTTDTGSLIVAGSNCGSSCTIVNGQTLAVQITTSGASSTGVTASISLGTFDTSFTAVTASAVGELLFFNMTPSLVDFAPRVSQHFWAGMPDMNGDGCLDLFVGTHADENADSSLLLQNRNLSGCAGDFTHIPTTDSNYTQPALGTRITGRYIFGNWYDDPDGIWSFVGQDVDGAASARYVIADSVNPGDVPQYDTKSIGCFGSAISCLPVDLDGDGTIEMVSRQRSDTDPNMFHVLDANTGNLLLSPSSPSPIAGQDAIFDVDNDGVPELISVALGGYYKFTGASLAAGTLTWQANKFPGGSLPPNLAADSHQIPIDYDNDGDLDLFFGIPVYSDLSVLGVPFAYKSDSDIFEIFMYENDGSGNFTDVTAAADLDGAGLLKNTYFHSLYGNSVAADVNLDGYVDIVYGAESGGHSATETRVTFVMNNGDGTFSVDRTNNLGEFVTDGNFQGRPFIEAGDYDNDGRLDIVKTHGVSGPNHESVGLYRNITDVGGNDWLRVRVRGKGANTDGLHTRLVFRDVGTNAIVTSYQVGVFDTAYRNLLTHAGLGNRATIKLEVFYPHSDGLMCTFNNLNTNQDIVVYPDCNLLEGYVPGSAVPIDSAAAAAYTGTTIAPLVVVPGVDTIPNVFNFTNEIDQVVSSTVTSNSVTIAGLGAAVNATVTTDIGTLIIGGSPCASSCTVANGQTLAVQVTSAATPGTTVSATVTIGGTFSRTFNATTAAADTTPNVFVFVAQTGLPVNSAATSAAVTITGLGTGVAAPVTADLGTLIIEGSDCAGPCTIENGETLAVRVTTSTLTGTLVTANVTVGTYTTGFAATTTGIAPDLTPDSFSFAAQTGLTASTEVTSATITVAGLGAAVTANVVTDFGTLIIDGTPCASLCTIANDQTLAVSVTTSATGLDDVVATVTLGTFSTAFSATTGIVLAAKPGTLNFTAVDNAVLNQFYDSNTITFNWLNATTAITTTEGNLLINGIPCVAACTVDYNDTFAVRQISAGTIETPVSVTVTVDGVSGDYTITTGTEVSSSGGSDDSLPVVIEGFVSNQSLEAGQIINNLGVVTNLSNSGTFNGGTLGGAIVNSTTGIINNVNLAPGSTVSGGNIKGVITGSGKLTNVLIGVTSLSPNIKIGAGSKVTAETVRNVSGLVLTDALKDTEGRLQLSQSILVDDNGNELSVLDIAKAEIDKLFGAGNTGLADGADTGTVMITNASDGGLAVPVAPVSVETTNEPDSVSIANARGELVIISRGIKTTFTPAAADLAAFQAGIGATGAESRLLVDGSVSIEFNGTSFALRFSPVVNQPSTASASTLRSISALTHGEASFAEVGTASDPANYRVLVQYPDGSTQIVLPAIHDSSAFDAWLQAGGFAAEINGIDGTISFKDPSLSADVAVVWRGIPSYVLMSAINAASSSVDFKNTTDLNGDGIGDIYFDTGSFRQVIYGLPPLN